MNYLAHLYLSGNDPILMIGNFIADHVKGKQLQLYGKQIQNGILLHRKIDSFTDHHSLVEESKQLLRPVFHKYASVIVDVFYDHFLARDWNQYHRQPLSVFVASAYKLMEENSSILPQRTVLMLGYMKKYNWLESYASIDGIGNALTGMSHRTKFESGMEHAPEFFVQHYKLFEKHFMIFFKELENFVSNERKNLQA